MNIFVLDLNQKLSAQYHTDKHCVKMILEQVQLLTTAHHVLGTDVQLIPYKKVNQNHPCNKWVRESLSNYLWLISATKELCIEYTYRYKRHHKCEKVLLWCKENLPNMSNIGLTTFAQAMPDKYKNKNIVKAYRSYYLGEKRHLFNWKKRPIPSWIL